MYKGEPVSNVCDCFTLKMDILQGVAGINGEEKAHPQLNGAVEFEHDTIESIQFTW